MMDLHRRLLRYENENTLLSPDAQTGVRKSIAAALGERKGSTQEGNIYAVVYPYSVDVERIVDGLCGLVCHSKPFLPMGLMMDPAPCRWIWVPSMIASRPR